MYVPAGCPAFARPCEGVHRSMHGLSSFDSFRDEWKVAAQLLL